MTDFAGLVGSDEIRQRIGDAVRANRLSHAYLLEGRSGSGKKTFARMIAAALSCAHKADKDTAIPCGVCLSCKRILSGNSPDVLTYGRGERAAIGVDVIRDLRREAVLSAGESDARVFLIDGADTMTAAAQNALLILLEEPPADVLLLLLCESSLSLLPTVRSRAQLFRMGYIGEAEMRQYLTAHSSEAAKLDRADPDRLSVVISASDGRIGEALRLLSPKSEAALMKERQTVSNLVTALTEGKNYASVVSAVFALPTKRVDLLALYPMLQSALRDLAVLRRAPDAQMLFFTDRSAAAALAGKAEYSRLLRLYDAVRSAEADTAANGNIQMILTTLASSAFRRS